MTVRPFCTLNRENNNTNHRGHRDVTFYCRSPDANISAHGLIRLQCSVFQATLAKVICIQMKQSEKTVSVFSLLFFFFNVGLPSTFLKAVATAAARVTLSFYYSLSFFQSSSKDSAERKLSGR